MELQSQVIRDIHDHLQDDESKFIFGNRLMYSVTGNRSYLQVIIDKLPEAKWLKAEIEHSEENFIFGAGTRCRDLYYLAPDKWAGIIDNDETKWGKEFSGGGDNCPAKRTLCTPACESISFRPQKSLALSRRNRASADGYGNCSATNCTCRSRCCRPMGTLSILRSARYASNAR